MLKIAFKPSFVRQVKKLSAELQHEVIEKIELFKHPQNHSLLKVHKLQGPLRGCHAFSVNFRFRIVFEYVSETEVVLLAVGDHDIYK